MICNYYIKCWIISIYSKLSLYNEALGTSIYFVKSGVSLSEAGLRLDKFYNQFAKNILAITSYTWLSPLYMTKLSNVNYDRLLPDFTGNGSYDFRKPQTPIYSDWKL